MTKGQDDHRQRVEALRKTRQSFDMLILQGKPDPYRELFATKKKLIVGPAGSLLLAMTRIPVAGGRSLYRCIANRALFDDQDARELIRSRFLSREMSFAVWPDRNPAIIANQTGEVLEKLEWHHSPNHIMTVCLIPHRAHRQTELHAEGAVGMVLDR